MERKSPSVWLGPEKKLSAISFQLSAFSLWGRLKPQCHLVFPLSNICINCGADPLVRGRRPRRPVRGWMRLILLAKSGSRGTRADQGVRPTTYAEFPVSGKLNRIGLKPAPQAHAVSTVSEMSGDLRSSES